MSNYEYIYILRGELSSTQVEEINSKYQELLQNHNSSIKSSEYWGLRNLAYKIKKNKKAHYYFLNIEASIEGLKELQRHMSVNENILRFLAIKVDELDVTPSLMVKKPERSQSEEDAEKDTEKALPQEDVTKNKQSIIDYKNIDLLKRYTSERGKILPRRLTLASAKEQRNISQAIKRARFLSLIAPLVR